MNCRSCKADTLTEVADLGSHRLSDFRDPGDHAVPAWPLRLMLCVTCWLVQLGETTPRELLYHDRYGFKSGVNEAIRRDLENIVKYALSYRPGAKNWLDIACNDGTLLSYVPKNIWKAGVDPVGPLSGEATAHADLVIQDFFSNAYFSHTKFDVITSISMFYDLDDPEEFVNDVKRVMADDGIWIIQQNSVADMLRANAIDNVCHEHVTYFSATSLKHLLDRCGLYIYDVSYSTVNGGCIRTVVGKNEVCSRSLMRALSDEMHSGVTLYATYTNFIERVRAQLGRLDAFLGANDDVMLYGASTRGGTFMQILSNASNVRAAVERNPAKVGKIMTSTGLPIISEKEMREANPEHLLISPWFFRDVFVEREREYLDNGGTMLFPLPQFEIFRRFS